MYFVAKDGFHKHMSNAKYAVHPCREAAAIDCLAKCFDLMAKTKLEGGTGSAIKVRF